MTRLHHFARWSTTGQALPAWLALAGLLGGVYLFTANILFGYGGFPLDDAWIHQTYARNLAQTGQFAFVPGVTSTGSTAPLWTLLLSLGYLLGLPFKVWTHALALAALGLSGWTAARLSRKLWPDSPGAVALASGLFVLAEWHLTWAAVSGMETILFVWLSLLLVERYLAWQQRLETPARFAPGLALGVLGGCLALARPEGLGLLGLIGLDAGRRWWISGERDAAGLARIWLSLGLGALIPLAPYLLFNLKTTGFLLPNTFYAKQQEYAILLARRNLLQRWLAVSGVTLVGAQLLLLPGLVYAALMTVGLRGGRRRPELGLVWAWWLGYLLLYSLRLPVTYQHGRYEIPTLPWLLLLGSGGSAGFLQLGARALLPRVLSRAWLLAVTLLAAVFIVVGAQAYARDVRIIDTEMVDVAHWLRANTPPEALIAAHDIGAIGYFTRRPLLDLAGLVTPEVIPFIRDEAQLLSYIRERRAQYLVTFPSWYPTLVAAPGLSQVYSTGAPWARAAGNDNMAVYRLEPP